MNKNLKFALFAAFLVIVGMLAGFKIRRGLEVQKDVEINDGLQKIQQAIWYVEKNYVEEPDHNQMIDDAINGIMEGLDPHSFYIPVKEMQQMEEQMSGSFEGIGIEFNILEDTIYVVTPISGGPSEMLGIQSGDRIVYIDGENVGGIGITNSDVMKKLRGEKGTIVSVKVKRRGVAELIQFDIKRDKIPLYSVDYSYMIEPGIGYLKVNRFSETTYDEFIEHLNALKSQGMEGLILDLRGNPGGYMQKAQFIADEFLSEGKMVVYTEGRMPETKSKYVATSYKKAFEEGALVVLLDYGSASASEIVAGAVQDWDRGLIVGVRSFGKGLVQTQTKFSDGSAIRIVVSKYYTPSGRCIQKEYHKTSEDYNQEILDRFESGEIYDPSKIKFPDSLKYKTNAGRTVYGGGGIMPDVFVPRDTSYDSDYMTNLISKSIFREFSYYYHDLHPELAKKYKEASDFNKGWTVDQNVEKEFRSFAKDHEVEFDEEGWKQSAPQIRHYIKAFIGRTIYNDDGFYPNFHKSDNVLQRAIELMPAAKHLEKTGEFKNK